MVRVVESREDAEAGSLVIELQVYREDGQICGAVVPVNGLFALRRGHVERIYLYAVDLCMHHGIPNLWINDPDGLFTAYLRREHHPDLGKQRAAHPSPANPEPPDLRRGPINPETLIFFGFQHVAFWQMHTDPGRLNFRGQVDGKPSVYLFVVENEVRFVGAAHSGLRQRMDHYAHAGRTQAAVRIRRSIVQELIEGRTVHVLAQSFSPVIRDVDGLPVDMVAGTQAGLRRILQPPWNKVGDP